MRAQQEHHRSIARSPQPMRSPARRIACGACLTSQGSLSSISIGRALRQDLHPLWSASSLCSGLCLRAQPGCWGTHDAVGVGGSPPSEAPRLFLRRTFVDVAKEVCELASGVVALLRCLSFATSCGRRAHGFLSNSAALGDRRSATTKLYSCRCEAPPALAAIDGAIVHASELRIGCPRC